MSFFFKNGKRYKLVKCSVEKEKKNKILIDKSRVILLDYNKKLKTDKEKFLLDKFYNSKKINYMCSNDYKLLIFLDQFVGCTKLNFFNFLKENEKVWLKNYNIKFFFSKRKFNKNDRKYKIKKNDRKFYGKKFSKKNFNKFTISFNFLKWKIWYLKKFKKIILYYFLFKLLLNDINRFFKHFSKFNKYVKKFKFYFLNNYNLKNFNKIFKKVLNIKKEKFIKLINYFFFHDVKNSKQLSRLYSLICNSKKLIKKEKFILMFLSISIRNSIYIIFNFLKIYFK